MGRNFDGVGIGFEFDDSKATPRIKSMTESMEELWGGLQKAGNIAGGAGQKLKGAFANLSGMGQNAFGRAQGAVQGMIDSAMSPQLDNAYSSMYATFNKSFSAMVAGMDMSSKEAKKLERTIGGVAFSLNEDMDTAAKSFLAFRKQNVDLVKFLGSKGGTKGAVKDLIKVTSVFGIEGEQLANIVSGLKYSFGFTEEQVGTLGDKIYVLGKKFNIGAEAIQAWPSIYEALNNELADFGKTLKPEEVEQMTLSIMQLGAGFKESMGMPAQSAMELARQLFTTLSGERKNIINMFRGMGGEFGDVAKQLMETGGSVDGMFGMLMKGDPLKFMDMLREMAAQAEKQGGSMSVSFQRLLATMNTTLGPDVTYAMKGNWDSVRESMAKLPEELNSSKVKGALTEAANKFHKTGLTAGEGWERMVEGMKANLQKFSKDDVNAWKKNMKAGFENTEEVIGKLASDQGPIGEVTRKLLLVQRVGLSGLLPAAKEGEVGLQGIAGMMGGIVSQSFPMMTALGSMGLDFGALGKMALGGGLIYGLFKVLKDGPDAVIDKLKNLKTALKEGIQKNFPDLYSSMIEWRNKLKDPKFWKESVDKLSDLISSIDFKGMFAKVGGIIEKIPWGKILSTAGGAAKAIAKGLARLVKAAFKGMDAKDIGQAVMSVVQTVAGVITEFFGTLFSSDKMGEQGEVIKAGFGGVLVDGIMGALKMVYGMFQGFWNDLFKSDSISGAIGNIVKYVAIGFTAIMVLSKKFRKAFIKDAGQMYKEYNIMTKCGLSKAGSVARVAYKRMAMAAKAARTAIGIASPLFGFIEGAAQVKKQSAELARIMADKTISEANRARLGGERAAEGFASTLDAVLIGIPGMISEALGMSERDWRASYQRSVGDTEVALHAMAMGWDVFTTDASASMKLFVEKVGIGWDMVVLKVKQAWGAMKLAGQQVANAIMGAIDNVMYPMQKKLLDVKHSIQNAMTDITVELFKKLTSLKGVTGFGWIGEAAEKYLQVVDNPIARKKREEDQRKERDDLANYYLKRDESRLLAEQAIETENERLKKDEEELKIRGELYNVHQKMRKLDVLDAKLAGTRTILEAKADTEHAIKESDRLALERQAREEGPESKAYQELWGPQMEACKKKGKQWKWDYGKNQCVKKKWEGKGAAPTSVPTVEDRAAMETPKDAQTRSLLYSVNNLAMSVADFTRNPLNVSVNIAGDINKFLSASAKYEKRNAPSGSGR